MTRADGSSDTAMKRDKNSVAAIAIGRNEGPRLGACLSSLKGKVHPIIYVDSGSTDESVELASAAGAEVVELDMSLPFTAARARNAGFAHLRSTAPDTRYVQFLDSDCELDPGWIDAGTKLLGEKPDVAVVGGRRREKHPQATFWNGLIDAEWDRPSGEVLACGGDALMRCDVVADIGGYREDLIAGEEPEMCFRMREAGWRIWRLDTEMTRHDAALTRLSQWWQRARRTGHTYAQGVALHGNSPERYKRRELRRTVIWGGLLPAVAILGAFLTPWALLLLLAYPAQILRLTGSGTPLSHAVFLVFGKIPEMQGVMGYWTGQIAGRRHTLIEYK